MASYLLSKVTATDWKWFSRHFQNFLHFHISIHGRFCCDVVLGVVFLQNAVYSWPLVDRQVRLVLLKPPRWWVLGTKYQRVTERLPHFALQTVWTIPYNIQSNITVILYLLVVSSPHHGKRLAKVFIQVILAKQRFLYLIESMWWTVIPGNMLVINAYMVKSALLWIEFC